MRYQIPCNIHLDWPCCGCNTEVLTGDDAREAFEADQDLLWAQHDFDCEQAELAEELAAEEYDDMQDFEDRYCPEAEDF